MAGLTAAALLQTYGHSAQAESSLEAELRASQFEDDAIAILQPSNFRATNDGYTRTYCIVSADDIRDVMHVIRDAGQARFGNTDGADANATDFQPVRRAVKGNGSLAAASAEDETGLDDPQVNDAGCLRRRCRRNARQHHRRQQQSRTKFHCTNEMNHYRLPVYSTCDYSSSTKL